MTSAVRLEPPRWLRHGNFAGCLIGIGLGVAFLAAALDPEIQSWIIGLMGACSVVVSVYAAARSYRVHVLLDDTTLHVHGTFWSKRIARDRITAVSDVGQVEYEDARGSRKSVRIMWLMRQVNDDERFVLARLQRPWREAIATLRDCADVTGGAYEWAIPSSVTGRTLSPLRVHTLDTVSYRDDQHPADCEGPDGG